MLQCPLIQLLVGCNKQKIDVHTVPVVENCNEQKCEQIVSAGHGPEENISPFTFTAQRIRIDKDDEMFEDGDVHRHLYLQDLATTPTDDSSAAIISEFQCHIAGCKQLFDTLEGYEHHYNLLHRHVCSSCKRSFPSNQLLDIHILEWHDTLFQVMAEKQCMYQCLVEGCGLKFRTAKERKDHLIMTHSYPSDFRFDKSNKIKRETKGKKTAQQKKICMTVLGNVDSPHSEAENCESMDFSPTQGPESQPVQQKPQYSYKVPQSICFGQGSVRGFRGGRRKK
ncbi:zinc finger protein 511 [Trichomycterus rosablanca]|uniref:zinc finger protein 511 n=1 Tax=Trichomycterus rosablanca TaxID=2290929 RepID=UPI002F353C72